MIKKQSTELHITTWRSFASQISTSRFNLEFLLGVMLFVQAGYEWTSTPTCVGSASWGDFIPSSLWWGHPSVYVIMYLCQDWWIHCFEFVRVFWRSLLWWKSLFWVFVCLCIVERSLLWWKQSCGIYENRLPSSPGFLHHEWRKSGGLYCQSCRWWIPLSTELTVRCGLSSLFPTLYHFIDLNCKQRYG